MCSVGRSSTIPELCDIRHSSWLTKRLVLTSWNTSIKTMAIAASSSSSPKPIVSSFNKRSPRDCNAASRYCIATVNRGCFGSVPGFAMWHAVRPRTAFSSPSCWCARGKMKILNGFGVSWEVIHSLAHTVSSSRSINHVSWINVILEHTILQ